MDINRRIKFGIRMRNLDTLLHLIPGIFNGKKLSGRGFAEIDGEEGAVEKKTTREEFPNSSLLRGPQRLS